MWAAADPGQRTGDIVLSSGCAPAVLTAGGEVGAIAAPIPSGQRAVGCESGAATQEVGGEMAEQPAVTLVPLRAPRGRRSWTITHNGRRYAVFAVNGELQVTDAACPHNGGPLARGVIRGGIVTCPWHWYSFELTSGRCLTSAALCLRKYPVISRGGRSYAELPGEVRWPRWRQLLGIAARPSRPGTPPA